MPGLGNLVLKNNIIAVKFTEALCEKIKFIPQKLLHTKKHVNLYMEVDYKSVEKNNLARSQKIKYERDPTIETIREMPDVCKKLVEIRPTRYF